MSEKCEICGDQESDLVSCHVCNGRICRNCFTGGEEEHVCSWCLDSFLHECGSIEADE